MWIVFHVWHILEHLQMLRRRAHDELLFLSRTVERSLCFFIRFFAILRSFIRWSYVCGAEREAPPPPEQ